MSHFRVVADTNVFLSSFLSDNKTSPSNEFVKRWANGEFSLLINTDLLIEYKRKLTEHGFLENDIQNFLSILYLEAENINIAFFHLSHYPVDPDDVLFLLCALNGNASHLVTYDMHLLDLIEFYKREVNITKLLPFLSALRDL